MEKVRGKPLSLIHIQMCIRDSRYIGPPLNVEYRDYSTASSDVTASSLSIRFIVEEGSFHSHLIHILSSKRFLYSTLLSSSDISITYQVLAQLLCKHVYRVCNITLQILCNRSNVCSLITFCSCCDPQRLFSTSLAPPYCCLLYTSRCV